MCEGLFIGCLLTTRIKNVFQEIFIALDRKATALASFASYRHESIPVAVQSISGNISIFGLHRQPIFVSPPSISR